jgi:putative N6-adenine-specific DNA methylase
MADRPQRARILVTCARAMPPFLAGELRGLGFTVEEELAAAVRTTGTLRDTWKLNLHLRTAHRVLYELVRFHAANADALYHAAVRFPWEEWVPASGHLCVNSAADNATIRDPRIVNLRCKDAVVDRVRDRRGMRPNSGHEQNGTVLFVYWKDDEVTLYLDTSGEPLSRRGYRLRPGRAPVQETLAAGIVLATGWRGETPFVNPMCGSGTLAIEAALLASGRASGALRADFGFRHVVGFPAPDWERVRREAADRPLAPFRGRVIATDISPQAVNAARENARAAGVARHIEFKVCDFAATEVPPGGGVVVLNPEYGERMGDAARLEPLYSRIGDFFKQRCQGCRGFVFTGNAELGKRIGLRTCRRVQFFNSRIECRLLGFDLYSGTRRAPRPVTGAGVPDAAGSSPANATADSPA